MVDSAGLDQRYIAVEGPIGVGKTSLARLLAERLGGRLVLEEVEDNPFLARFYQDRSGWAFQTQLFFLLSRWQQQQKLLQTDLFASATVSDYVFAKDRIFATLTLQPAELALYDRVYGHLPPVPSGGSAPAHQAPRARVRAPLRRRLPGGALPVLQRLLLPLLGDAAAGHQHQRHRLRAQRGRPGQPGLGGPEDAQGRPPLPAPVCPQVAPRTFPVAREPSRDDRLWVSLGRRAARPANLPSGEGSAQHP